MTSPRTLSFGWYVAVALIALYGSWYLSDFFRFRFEPAILLPLLLGWLAWRSSGSLTSLWLLLGILVVIDLDLRLLGTVSIGFGLSALFALLGVAAAYTVSRPVSLDAVRGLFNQRWAWLKWLLPVALFLAIHVRWWPEFELADDLELSFKPGLIILAAVLLAGIDTRALRAAIDTHVCNSDRSWVNQTRLVVLGILVLAIFVDLDWRAGALRFAFGFGGASVLVYVAVTVLALRRIVDWRLLIVGLLAFLAIEWPYDWAVDAVDAFLESLKQEAIEAPASGGDAIELIVVQGSRIARFSWFREGAIYGTSLILMATALAPFAATRNIEDLFERRTIAFVLAALGIAIVGQTLFLYGMSSFGVFLLGIAAFLCGLKWKVRGLLLSPVALQLAYVLMLTFLPDLNMLAKGALDVVTIGFYSFAFAYFGMLSNRLIGNTAGIGSAAGEGP